MSVEVAGGELVLLLVIVILELISVAGASSMNQVISVRGRLNSVIVTINMRGEPATASMSLGAVEKTGPTVVNCRREPYWLCNAHHYFP